MDYDKIKFSKTVTKVIEKKESKLDFESPFDNTKYNFSIDLSINEDNKVGVLFTTGFNDTHDYDSSFLLDSKQLKQLETLLYVYHLYCEDIENIMENGYKKIELIREIIEQGKIKEIYVYLSSNKSPYSNNKLCHKYNIYFVPEFKYKYLPSVYHFNITIYSDLSKYEDIETKKEYIAKGILGLKSIIPQIKFKKCRERFEKDNKILEDMKSNLLNQQEEYINNKSVLPNKVDHDANINSFLSELLQTLPISPMLEDK